MSQCKKYDEVKGSGAFPYNFRVIDGKLFAGGNLFNPVTHKNGPEKVREMLASLKKMGVKSVIALNVPAGMGKELSTVKQMSGELGMEFYPCRMNSETVPDEKQTEKIMKLIDEGAYVHCNWGCDRTGAVIAKYLVTQKGYSGKEALEAVVASGTHSGKNGGFKQTPMYKKLVLYFWPEVSSESPATAQKYQITK